MNLSYRQHIKNTISLAYPVVIGQLGQVMLGVVDTFMLGKIGAVPLAASAIANGMFFLIFIIGLGVSFAVTPIVAISAGAKRTDDYNNILQQSLILNIVLGILLNIVSYFSADLIQYLNQPKDVAEQAEIFLKILGAGLLPLMIFQTFKQFIEGLSIMKPAMIITILANFVNAFGNWLLIFGNLGFPRLGLYGSGYSTLITRIIMAITIVIYVFYSVRFKTFNLSLRIKKVEYKIIKKILQLGLPSGFQYFFEVGAFTSSSVMVGWIGTEALAAHQIAMNLVSITYMCATGISAAAMIRVGNGVGAQNITETRKAGFTALSLTIAMMSFFALLLIIFNRFFPSLYINDENVIAIASSLLIIGAFFQVFDGSQAVGLGMLRGIMDVKIPLLITLIAYWVIMIPSGYFLAFKCNLGIRGVWIGYIIGLVTSAVLLNLRFYVRSKKKIIL